MTAEISSSPAPDVDGAQGDGPRPKLSVILISYNMAREVPRTLQSLSPPIQKGIAVEDYEIILVDNGSSQVFAERGYQAISPNIRTIRNDPQGSVSPVGAIERGMAAARGDLIGVLIDGARMASPGLLATALKAAELAEQPVVATIAFHLGPDEQMKSIHEGYNQEVEDALLRQSGWRQDAYRLFNISTLAGSSRLGWFHLPAETNALFMKRETWDAVGGFDPGFQTPGGGLCNLDVWKRACLHPGNEVILLFGEATFHQFHGGVATNAKVSPYQTYQQEYTQLRGEPYTRPDVPFSIYGSVQRRIAQTIRYEKPEDTA
ncbi:MAG: glycosyltransferase [Litorimonas sp.]